VHICYIKSGQEKITSSQFTFSITVFETEAVAQMAEHRMTFKYRPRYSPPCSLKGKACGKIGTAACMDIPVISARNYG
jgi:hypothetical protein